MLQFYYKRRFLKNSEPHDLLRWLHLRADTFVLLLCLLELNPGMKTTRQVFMLLNRKSFTKRHVPIAHPGTVACLIVDGSLFSGLYNYTGDWLWIACWFPSCKCHMINTPQGTLGKSFSVFNYVSQFCKIYTDNRSFQHSYSTTVLLLTLYFSPTYSQWRLCS